MAHSRFHPNRKGADDPDAALRLLSLGNPVVDARLLMRDQSADLISAQYDQLTQDYGGNAYVMRLLAGKPSAAEPRIPIRGGRFNNVTGYRSINWEQYGIDASQPVDQKAYAVARFTALQQRANTPPQGGAAGRRPLNHLLRARLRPMKAPESLAIPQISKEEIQKRVEQKQTRMRELVLGAYGRSDTILTSSRGLPGEATTRRKTLLGS